MVIIEKEKIGRATLTKSKSWQLNDTIDILKF